MKQDIIMHCGRFVSTTSLCFLLFIVSWQHQITASFLSTGVHFDVNLPGFKDVTDVGFKRELNIDCQPYSKMGCFDRRVSPMKEMKYIMDNVNGNETLAHDLVCLCSMITTDLKSRYFAISNNECLYGDDAPSPNGVLNSCKHWADQKQDCDVSSLTETCVGAGNSTFIYRNRIDGAWTLWEEWSPCSATCGTQNKIRTRSCTDPAPFGGGSNCEGEGTESQACPAKVGCPVDGVWGQYGEWSACSATCGTQNENSVRTRTCTPPELGGSDCEGATTESKPCSTTPCPVNGGWSNWGGWSACSATCGTQNENSVRARTCTNPAPVGDGSACAGASSESKSCSVAACPVDGGWSSWGTWGACSATCGNRNKIRTRTCTNPKPSGGGSNCAGAGTEAKLCPAVSCVVNGGYTAWVKTSHCSTKCGMGSLVQRRFCTNPAPSGGGSDCSSLGPAIKNLACFTKKCPVPCNDNKCSYQPGGFSFINAIKKAMTKVKCIFESTRMICPKLCGAC